MAGLLCALAALPLFAAVAADGIRVDFGSVVGPVKPVNGVGQPPVLGWGD